MFVELMRMHQRVYVLTFLIEETDQFKIKQSGYLSIEGKKTFDQFNYLGAYILI